MEIRRLGRDDVGLIALIDRSEQVGIEYEVVDGKLRERPVTHRDVSPWDPVGDGPHSVGGHVADAAAMVDGGGELYGAFDGDEVLGLMIVNPTFEPQLSWFAWLHVSRPHRRRGAASALWQVAVDRSRAAGATTMYVSATPTGSAVGFYRSRGCRLADPPHAELFEHEPEDIHLVLALE